MVCLSFGGVMMGCLLIVKCIWLCCVCVSLGCDIMLCMLGVFSVSMWLVFSGL